LFSRINPLRLPIIYPIAVNPVLTALPLLLLPASLLLFALLASITHNFSLNSV
jgi:hypothetical protein